MTIYTEVALSTRLRRLAEMLSKDADQLMVELDAPVRSSHFYVVYALDQLGPQTMTDIAALSGFTHSSVSQAVKKLAADGLVELEAGDDGRQKTLSLSTAGKAATQKLRPIWDHVGRAVKGAIDEGGIDFMGALDRMEAVFTRKGLHARVQALMKAPPPVSVDIIPYEARYGGAFRDLNIRWVEADFEVDEIDLKVLDNPDGAILNRGGEIWFAVADGKPVGTFALKREDGGRWEFTKFAVDPAAQGLGIGGRLMACATERFQARGGRVLFLETNTSLKVARAVYDKYGWVEKPMPAPSPYARANCYMEWEGRDRHSDISSAKQP